MPVVNTNSDIATAATNAAVQYPTTEQIVPEILLFIQAKVTVPAAISVNDTITILPAAACPVGAVLIPQMCTVYCASDPASSTDSLTLDIGTVADPDKFAAALVLKQAATEVLTGTGLTAYRGAVSFADSSTAPVAIATPYRFTTPEAIIATAKVVTNVTEAVLVFSLAFRCKA